MYSDLKDVRFFQGDIFKDTPFFIIPNDNEPAVQVENLTIMILSQTCDIQREERDFIIAAKVVEMQKLKDDSGAKETFIQGLRNRSVKYFFYLPPDNDLWPESYVDFQQIVYLPKKFLKDNNRVKSLSDLGRHWLLYQIADYFGRPIKR